MKIRQFCLLIFVGVFFLASCSFLVKKPEIGIWYNDELKIAIDFDGIMIEDEADYNAWRYAADGSVEPLLCLFDYGDGIYFSTFGEEEEIFIDAEFQYQNNQFIIRTEDEEYIFTPLAKE